MALTLGDTVPGFDLPGVGGEREALEDGGAPASVVYWTCNHCPYAVAWHDRLLDVARDYAGRGVRVLAINSNDAERYPADSFAAMTERVEADGGWPHPFLHDESQEVARAWDAEKTPHVFVVDSDLRLRYQGAPDADYEDPGLNAAWLRGALDAVLGGGEPEPAETPPVGCGIKWRG
jgi:peroxiredoxin